MFLDIRDEDDILFRSPWAFFDAIFITARRPSHGLYSPLFSLYLFVLCGVVAKANPFSQTNSEKMRQLIIYKNGFKVWATLVTPLIYPC